MASEKDIERELKRLEVQKQAFNMAERANQSMKSLAEATDTVREIDEEILDLTKAIEGATGDVRKELENEKALLEAESKELRKQLSLRKSIGNSILNSLKGQKFFLNDILGSYDSMDQKIRDVSMNMGISVGRMSEFRTNVTAVASDLAMLGISAEEVASAQGAYADETGRALLLTRETLNTMGRLGKSTGIGMDGIAQMAGEMEAFGLGGDVAVETIEGIADMTQKMGVNTGKVLKKFQQNLGLVNKLSFKNGIKGMASMAAHSEKYKISMEAVAGVAEKVFRPEGAIEAAANLQVLGGSLAQLGDPFQLMYKARHAPEELAKSLSNAAAQSAVFNKETGEFEVNAMELDRMTEAGAALGISQEELVKTAKQTAKMNMMEGLVGDLDPKQRELLASMAEMDGGVMKIDGKDIKSINKTERDNLIERATQSKKEKEERAEQSQSTLSLLKNIKTTLLASLLPLAQSFDEMLRGNFVDKLVEWTKSTASFVKDSLIPMIKDVMKFLGPGGMLGVILGFSAAKWIARGLWLAKGFNLGTMKKGFLASLGGMLSKFNPKNWKSPSWLKGLSSKTTSALSPQSAAPSVSSGAKDFLKSQKGGSGGIKSMMSADKISGLGKAAGGASKGMLAFGAAILMIGGAVAVAALGVSELVGAFEGLTGPQALAAFGSTVAIMGGFVAMMWALVAVVPALGAAGTVGAIGILAVGAAFLLMGAGIALVGLGISMIVDSFGNLFSQISAENIGPLLLLGPALMMVSLGIMALAASLVMLGVAFLAGGFLGLIALGETADTLQTAFKGIDSSNMDKSISAINSVDMEKIDALKELSAMMTMMGVFGSRPLEIVMSVDGDIDIKGEAGGKNSTGWINDPSFVSKLKDMIWEEMEKGKTGGKA